MKNKINNKERHSTNALPTLDNRQRAQHDTKQNRAAQGQKTTED
jgi:hypothetical protein